MDTAALAAAIGRSDGYVRLLVSKGIIAPMPERGDGGCLRFDFEECRAILRGTPYIAALDTRGHYSA